MADGPLDRTVDFLEKTDARDKTLKLLANVLKVIVWRLARTGSADRIAKISAMQAAIGEYRAITKLGIVLKNIRNVRREGPPASIEASLLLGSVVGDFFFKLFDNLKLLSKYQLLPYSPDRMADLSLASEFWGYIFQGFFDWLQFRKIGSRDKDLEDLGKSDEEVDKATWGLLRGAAVNVSDMLSVTPSYLGKFTTAVSTHDGFQGSMGVVAAVLAVQSHWQNTK